MAGECFHVCLLLLAGYVSCIAWASTWNRCPEAAESTAGKRWRDAVQLSLGRDRDHVKLGCLFWKTRQSINRALDERRKACKFARKARAACPSFVWKKRRLLGNEARFCFLTRKMIWMDFCDEPWHHGLPESGFFFYKLPWREERVLNITYYPLAVFRVRPVTRCTSSLSGHIEASGLRKKKNMDKKMDNTWQHLTTILKDHEKYVYIIYIYIYIFFSIYIYIYILYIILHVCVCVKPSENRMPVVYSMCIEY